MTGSDATIGGDLTPREREVLAMVAAGLTNREIGEALFISESTAGVHVSHLMAKLGVGSRTEAAAWAYQAGLVEAAPGSMVHDGPPGDAAPSPPEPPAGWFGRLRDRLRQRDGRMAAVAIGGVALLAVITVGLAIAVLNGKQPVVGDLPSPSASPSLAASASASVEPSASATAEPSGAPSSEATPTPGTATPTPIPLPKGTWSATGTMSENRTGFQTATLLGDGTVLVAGGQNQPHVTKASAELYHPMSGEWTITGEMGEDRYYHSATRLDDGTVLIAGGIGISGADTTPDLATAELFDPMTGSWRATSPMNAARAGQTATLLDDGTVLVAGGFAPDGGFLASAEIYDPRAATWTAVAPMADRRSGHTATLLEDGTVLVAGGSRAGGSSVAVATLFDPDSRTWSAAGRMGTGRYWHTATLLGDGTVLVAGGLSDIGPQASAEIYQPSTKSWVAVASMAEPRPWGPTATLLHDGTVLLVGGLNPITGAAEVYDPRNRQWAATARMPQGRSFHTATLLESGEVLVLGGQKEGPGLNTVTFLYDPDGGP